MTEEVKGGGSEQAVGREGAESNSPQGVHHGKNAIGLPLRQAGGELHLRREEHIDALAHGAMANGLGR